MPVKARVRQHRCRRCQRSFTNRTRLQHHWAADHAPRTSADIFRTAAHIAKTRDLPGTSLSPWKGEAP